MNLKIPSKRVNFLSIQNSHTVACAGYHQPYIRTGYENIMPYRVGKLYSYMAEDDGKVLDITNEYILVEYNNGRKQGITLGRQFGHAEGSVYAHDIVTPLTANKKFKKGDCIAFNEQFFEKDAWDPTKIIMKSSLICKVALMETSQTIEDSSSVTTALAAKLSTRIVKERVFTVRFKQNIRNIVTEGTDVHPKDVLFILEDEITSDTDIFDSDTIEALSRLSNLAPKAKILGHVDRYEVYYNGDLEDMSPTLRKLAQKSDKMLWERTKHTEHPIKNGRVNEEYRVEGKALQLDTMVIKVYLIQDDLVGLGDKVVYGHQLKSIVSETISYPIVGERGDIVDAIFGYKSISNRIVLSPLLMGTTISLLKIVAKKAISAYKT